MIPAFPMPVRRAAGALLALLPLLAVAGCKAAADDGEAAAAPAVEVTVVEVTPRAVPLPYEFPGRVTGSREVEVRPRVSGILLRRTFAEGRPVDQGETLFTIDPAPYEAEVAAAAARLAEERAQLARARRERDRLEPLLAERAVSRRDVDNAVSEVELVAAQVQSAEASLDRARLELSYTRVTAPIGGLTSRAQVSEGTLVSPETLLTRISQVQPIWVRFAMSDEEWLGLRQAIDDARIDAPPAGHREVEIVYPDGRVHPERGRIDFSDSIIDPETGSLDLRAELPNDTSSNGTGSLIPGQFVRVRLVGMERPATILVPQRAVQQGQDGKQVFVVAADGTAEARPVEVGTWIGDQWVVESGLEAGERVIVDGLVRVRPGSPVTVAETLPPPPVAATVTDVAPAEVGAAEAGTAR